MDLTAKVKELALERLDLVGTGPHFNGDDAQVREPHPARPEAAALHGVAA